MKQLLSKLSGSFDISSPAAPVDIETMERHFSYSFPADYKEFLLFTNGLEGETPNDYLVLWSVKELIELNTAYHVTEFVQNVIIIGSDGAEDAFGFDTSDTNGAIIKLPFIGMGHIANEKVADTFEAFLSTRVKQENKFFGRLFG